MIGLRQSVILFGPQDGAILPGVTIRILPIRKKGVGSGVGRRGQLIIGSGEFAELYNSYLVSYENETPDK